jgi:hypothetical protein
MTSDFIVDIGKSNKMFKLIRGGSPKQIFVNSMHTSKYIRYAINEKLQSIWIAQRNGRTKDGNDQTQQAVLKMFGMSGVRDFVQNYSELNIAPIAISYEYDPGDFLKTREIYISRRKTYIKAPGEDMDSIITGIKQFKGKIHLTFAPPVSTVELNKTGNLPRNERMKNLATLIYKLWNTNYIAYDILNGNYSENIYSSREKVLFGEYLQKVVSKIEGDKAELKSILLAIYANPVVNYVKIKGHHKQNDISNLKHFECT